MSTAGHDDDPISAASTGLLALGVAPKRRMETLGLLAALLDLADERGEVLLDGELMETEERLGIDLCLEGYEWLERLNVIRRTWSGWLIPNFAAHRGPAGATVASLAVLRRHLDAPGDAVDHRPATDPAPAPVETTVVVPLRTWRRRVVVGTAASVAAGIAVLTGATQLVPQAAVSTRDAAIRTTGTARSLASVATPPTGAATTSTDASAAPAGSAATTTTSTTLLPGVPCLSDAVGTLTSRAGLGIGTITTIVTLDSTPPTLLPCP